MASDLAVLAAYPRRVRRPDCRALAPAAVFPPVDAVREGRARPPNFRLLAVDPKTARRRRRTRIFVSMLVLESTWLAQARAVSQHAGTHSVSMFSGRAGRIPTWSSRKPSTVSQLVPIELIGVCMGSIPSANAYGIPPCLSIPRRDSPTNHTTEHRPIPPSRPRSSPPPPPPLLFTTAHPQHRLPHPQLL